LGDSTVTVTVSSADEGRVKTAEMRANSGDFLNSLKEKVDAAASEGGFKCDLSAVAPEDVVQETYKCTGASGCESNGKDDCEKAGCTLEVVDKSCEVGTGSMCKECIPFVKRTTTNQCAACNQGFNLSDAQCIGSYKLSPRGTECLEGKEITTLAECGAAGKEVLGNNYDAAKVIERDTTKMSPGCHIQSNCDLESDETCHTILNTNTSAKFRAGAGSICLV